MIIFTYDPNLGQPMADGLAQMHVDDFLIPHSEGNTLLVNSASMLLLDCIRLRVADGTIKDTVKVKFIDEEVELNSYGNPPEWPRGMHVFSEVFVEIVRAQSKRRAKERQ